MADYNQVPEGQQPGMDTFNEISLNTPADDRTSAHLHGPLALRSVPLDASQGLEGRTASAGHDCVCGVRFTRSDALQRHITCKSKSVTPQYPCRFCNRHQGDKAFLRRDHLAQHLKIYHKIENKDERRRAIGLFIGTQPPVLSVPSDPNNVVGDLNLANTGGIGQIAQGAGHYEQHKSAAYGFGMGLDCMSRQQQPTAVQNAQYGIGYGLGNGTNYMDIQQQPTTLEPYQHNMMYDPINSGINYANVQQEPFQNDIVHGSGAQMVSMDIDPQLYVGFNAANGSTNSMDLGQQSFENNVEFEQYVNYESTL
ncbi:hypothetical protein F4809DRAFT_641955 [Biscogniauxia mediterranea]|nr:hypothetical protein F4809DRAFT_641955 [Biscogniauxia mediterranea]